MKTLRSTTEGVWVEIVPIKLTSEQEAMLVSDISSDSSIALLETIKNNSQIDAAQIDAEKAQDSYLKYKPTLLLSEHYQLISIDISISDNSATGILNFRLNGEQKQVRF
jgi:hypothetical protein